MAIQYGPDARVEQALNDAQTTAVGALQQLGGAMKGAGPEAHDALRLLTDRATNLPSLAVSVRGAIDKLAGDESLPADYRRTKVRDIHAAAISRLDEEREVLTKVVLPHLEQVLSESSLPQPNKDANAEVLRRQEVLNLVGGVTGPALMGKMADAVGQNPSWDSTMLSDFGRSLFAQAGLSQHDWQTFRAASAAKLMSSTTGTEKMLASRRALAAFHELKVRGHSLGLHQLAKSRLGDL